MIEAAEFPDPARALQYRKHDYWTDRSFHEVLFESARRHPDREVFADANRRLTYGDLVDQVKRSAAFFIDIGIKPGDVVTVQLPNRVEFPVVFFALELVGAIANQISPDFRASELEYILRF